MEVQLTDFENAAFTVFVVLLTRVVLAFDLALYIPLSKVDENMRRAQEVDSATTSRFFFRKYLAPVDVPSSSGASDSGSGSRSSSGGGTAAASDEGSAEPSLKKSRSALFLGGAPALASPGEKAAAAGGGGCGCGDGGSTGASAAAVDEDAYEEMSMSEIFHGKGPYYPGLLPLVYAYLDYIQCDAATYARIDEYLQFIGQRARGELKTTARWMRDFVQAHPSYKQDSVVSPDIALDLMMAAKSVGDGTLAAPELLGAPERVTKIDVSRAYGSVLKGQLSDAERSELVDKYMSRASRPRTEETPRGKGR